MKDHNGIINGMIANHLIEKDKLTKKIYEQLKEEGRFLFPLFPIRLVHRIY